MKSIPDSSRFWLYKTYQERFEAGQTPDTFDKEILRRWLADNGYTGKDGQEIPVVDPAVIDQMADAYKVPHRMVTGIELTEATNDPIEIRQVVIREIDKLLK